MWGQYEYVGWQVLSVLTYWAFASVLLYLATDGSMKWDDWGMAEIVLWMVVTTIAHALLYQPLAARWRRRRQTFDDDDDDE